MKYVWSELSTSSDLQKSYAIELKNRYRLCQLRMTKFLTIAVLFRPTEKLRKSC